MSWASLFVHVLLVACAITALFVFSEVTQAAQGRFWTGGSWRAWADVVLGSLLYAAVLAAGAGILAFGLSRLPVFSRRADITALATGLAAGLAVRWVLEWELGTADGGTWGVLALLVGGASLCVVLRVFRLLPVWVFCAVAAVALAAGVVLTPMVTRQLLTYAHRGALSAAIPWGWATVALAGGLIIAVFARRREGAAAAGVVGAILLAASLPLAFLAAPWFMPRQEPSMRRNVVLITADSLRADVCSVHGGDIPTPTLEKMAQEGVLFDRFYVPGPWTVPALCAMFSSKYPPGLTPGADTEQRVIEELSYHRFGPYFLDDDSKNFIERLRFDGRYRTGALIGNLAVLYQNWMLKGFEEVTFLDTLSYSVRGRFDLLPTLQAGLARLYPGLVRERTMDSTEALIEYANDYIARHRDENFFLWVHFMDPHTPFDPPARYRPDLPDAPEAWQQFPPYPGEPRVELAENVTDTEIHIARELYAGEVRYIDWAVGRILQTLRRHGLDDNTFVCFSSDHGEELYERGRYGHGYSMYDEVLRVPMVFTGPGITQGTVETPVSGIDLIPTFADLLHVTQRPEWRGRSLVPLMRGETLEDAPVYAQGTHHFRYHPEPLQAVIEWPWKLIRGLETANTELYNLAEDPLETANLANENASLAEALTVRLDEWSATFPMSFEEYTVGTDGLGEIPPDLREIFESQGYLGAAPDPNPHVDSGASRRADAPNRPQPSKNATANAQAPKELTP